MTAPDLDALIERLNEVNRLLYAHGAITITVKDVGKRGSLATEAAAALAELRAQNELQERETARYTLLSDVRGKRAVKAEARIAALDKEQK